MKLLRELPDVAMDYKTQVAGSLNRVGMTDIEVVMMVTSEGNKIRVPARASAFVSLDKTDEKGIHMSRLFSRLQDLAEEPLTTELLAQVVRSFQESHKAVSNSSELVLKFDIITKRQSLVSNLTGWRHYPITIRVVNSKTLTWSVNYEVAYSSTCPCSAALSRQLVQERFEKDFPAKDAVGRQEILDWINKEDSMCATPHSQRSFANVTLELVNDPKDILKLIENAINRTESTLKTPVQSFVKREDEQEFARLNAENLMFCEDAARRIRHLFENDPEVKKFSIEVEHQESLHPHNAVARAWSE